MTDGPNVFDQPVKNNLRTYDNIWKITTSQGDDYTTACLPNYFYFENYKVIAIDLCQQQELDTDPKALQQINFIGKVDRNGNKQFFSILKKPKKPFQIFHMELLKHCDCVLQFTFDIISI